MIDLKLSDEADPITLRGVFGQNLRQLSACYPSIAGLCRELGINRTQFNRYLGGESFPRPDVLHRICNFFDVDARILLEPVEKLQDGPHSALNHSIIEGFLGKTGAPIEENLFPNGFYRYSRPSFVEHKRFSTGLLWVFRNEGSTFVRGYEPRSVMNIQGLSASPFEREYRGIVLKQEQGLAIIAARRGATSCSFNFLTRLATFNNNYWEGYAARTTGESLTERRVGRLILEHIRGGFKTALEVARASGLCAIEELPPYHARLLKPDQPFR